MNVKKKVAYMRRQSHTSIYDDSYIIFNCTKYNNNVFSWKITLIYYVTIMTFHYE